MPVILLNCVFFSEQIHLSSTQTNSPENYLWVLKTFTLLYVHFMYIHHQEGPASHGKDTPSEDMVDDTAMQNSTATPTKRSLWLNSMMQAYRNSDNAIALRTSATSCPLVCVSSTAEQTRDPAQGEHVALHTLLAKVPCQLQGWRHGGASVGPNEPLCSNKCHLFIIRLWWNKSGLSQGCGYRLFTYLTAPPINFYCLCPLADVFWHWH